MPVGQHWLCFKNKTSAVLQVLLQQDQVNEAQAFNTTQRQGYGLKSEGL